MKTNYSDAFIEQAVIKLLSRGERTVRSVAQDINVNHHTAKNWIKKGMANKAGVLPAKERRPQYWNAQEQLLALHETHGLSSEALQAGCRVGARFIRPSPDKLANVFVRPDEKRVKRTASSHAQG